MRLEYKVKISDAKASWGIIINIEAEDFLYSTGELDNQKGTHIYKNLILIADEIGLIGDELNYLKLGIRWVHSYIEKYIDMNKMLIIQVHRIDFIDTDYQKEGLFCAIVGWLSKRFDFESPKIKSYFILGENRYFIDIPHLA